MNPSAPGARTADARSDAPAMLAALDTPVVLTDDHWRVLIGNAAAQRMLSVGLAPGTPIFDVLSLYGRDGQLVTAAHLQERHELGATWVEPQGTARTLAGTAIAVAFSVRNVGREAWLITLRENHAEVQLNRALHDARIEAEVARRSQRARARFLANMSHELRTPLNAIIGYAEMLMEEAEEDPQLSRVKPDLDKIRSSGRHLLGLINDVLDLSKVDAGRMTLNNEAISLQPFLMATARDVGALVTRRGNRLAVELAEDLGVIQADATKLRQCLFNLLGNAAKFTEGGTITLAAQRLGNTVLIEVRDTGVGIAPDQIDRLFDAFAQERSDTAANYGGTGLGLALVRALATLMGGEVAARSTPGVGSTFSLTVPVDAPADRTIEDGLASVIIASDDDAFARQLTTPLRSNGFLAEIVPFAALLAGTHAADAWIIDVRRDATAWRVLEATRATGKGAVVAIGAAEGDAARARRLGAAAYLSDPVDHGHLCLLLRARLAR